MHNKNSKEGFGKFFRLSKYILQSKLKIYFLYKKAAKKFESVGAPVENADLIVEIFKNIHFMTQSL